MFSHPTTIIFLTKGIAHITFVSNSRIVKTIRQEWNTTSLPKLFATVKANNTKLVRILLADEFSYILELTIPIHVLNKRLHIEQQLKTHIPEVLHSNEWDFKEIKSKSKEKKALVFAPVKYIYDALLKASESSGLHIEAVEPVQIAGKRHKNPVVGLAIKNDLKGKDEEVLNVIPTHYTPSAESQPDEDEIKSKDSPLKMWLLVLIVIVIMGGCAFVIYSQFTKPRVTVPAEQPTPTETVATPSAVLEPQPEADPPLAETPTDVPLEVSSITVQVLNGSGVPGASTEVKELLENEGFKEVTTGNADSYDYTKTIIQYKETIPSQIVPFVAELLTEYDIEESDLLTSDEAYDVLVIVGKKI